MSLEKSIYLNLHFDINSYACFFDLDTTVNNAEKTLRQHTMHYVYV